MTKKSTKQKRKRAAQNNNFTRKLLGSSHNNGTKNNKKEKLKGYKKLFNDISEIKTRNPEIIGEHVFSWILNPTKLDDYFKQVFEKESLIIKRNKEKYFSDIVTATELKAKVLSKTFTLGKDFTCSSYNFEKQERINMSNTEPKSIVDSFNNDGFSLRFLRPQDQFESISFLVTALESVFNTIGGCNIYLTPANSQGFAPHYDDVDVFVLQLEGKKHWKAFKPFKNEEGLYHPNFPALPLTSSGDFTIEEVESCEELEEVVDQTLSAGDFLYLPRGFVHFAKTEETHSLHLTISVNQRSTYGDLIVDAVRNVVSRSENLRKTLPRDMFDALGIMNTDDPTKETRREAIIEHIGNIFQTTIAESLDLDTTVDDLALKFMTEQQNSRTLLKTQEIESDDEAEDSKILTELNLNSVVSMACKNSARIVLVDGSLVVYHILKNGRVDDLPGLEFELEDAEMLELLLKSDPDEDTFIVKELPNDSDKDKLRVVQFLLQQQIIILL